MNPHLIIIIIIVCDHWPCDVSADSLLEWVLCVPIEGEADVAMQVNAVTAGMAPKRWVEMDQDTLAAQARDTWHSIQDGDSCRVLPIEDATLLELKPKWLHMRTLHEVFAT